MERNRLNEYPAYDEAGVKRRYEEALKTMKSKIVVLDDDPTGVQTVHDIFVYTDWSKESIDAGFKDGNPMFFILTNSRGFTAKETERVHKEIGERVVKASKDNGIPFILISRGDSTLRGHYPLETVTLKNAVEAAGIRVDGEILCPFFPEGGRYTIEDTHYVDDGTRLVPAGETEFAKDRTFGYANSDLKAWIEEKHHGEWKREGIESVSLEELRREDYASIESKLMRLNGFQKLVVNAVSYSDLFVFMTACIRCMNEGKQYIFRTAAAFTRVIGGVKDQPLLERDQLRDKDNPHGGLIIIGSHVEKTTRQLEALKKDKNICFLEFHVDLVSDENAFWEEQRRVIRVMNEQIENGRTTAIYTSRTRVDQNTGNREDDLKLSVKISGAVTGIAAALKVRPSFIIAKGGITSSDVGTKGLLVKKALVLGQVLPGIPVWKTGPESRFPGMSYVIFPGNVGDDNALYEIVEKMSQEGDRLK